MITNHSKMKERSSFMDCHYDLDFLFCFVFFFFTNKNQEIKIEMSGLRRSNFNFFFVDFFLFKTMPQNDI